MLEKFDVGDQIKRPEVFHFQSVGIDSYYICGISLTHEQPKEHIWTIVGSVAESFSESSRVCPCTRDSGTYGGTIPTFVEIKDYFCDTVVRGSTADHSFLYPDDPLWDGQGYGNTSACFKFNNPPWFYSEPSAPRETLT